MKETNAYKSLYMPDHHRAFTNGMVNEHILIAEQKLGRELKDEEVVHHIDKNKKNNDPDNILVLANSSDHGKIHQGYDFHVDEYGMGHIILESFVKAKRKRKSRANPNKKARIKVKYFCEKCGKQVSLKRVKLCAECYKLTLRKVERPNRNKLKSLIRQNSFLSIGRIFDVSDNAIRDWCKDYELPFTKSIINKFSDEEWEKI